jgi:hypothetical protein
LRENISDVGHGMFEGISLGISSRLRYTAAKDGICGTDCNKLERVVSEGREGFKSKEQEMGK